MPVPKTKAGEGPKASSRRSKASDKPGTRDKILDVAEIEFSRHGYEGTSLRMISEENDINLGLIHYYFGGKEGLFSAVFLRRSKALVNRRLVLLAEARKRQGRNSIPVGEIVRCFIAPMVEMFKEGEGPRAYIRLQGLLRSDPSPFSRTLRREAFNNTNKTFIEEIRKSCPHLTPASAVWRFSAMVSAYYSLVSQNIRVDELSDGRCDPTDIDAASVELLPFVVGGFDAPLGLDRDDGTKNGKGNGKKRPARSAPKPASFNLGSRV
jgi:AcrR family transcriptional regulator